jgi:2-polyprenyl-3-methyl-5-hydroxy-6-metoxy-1,4-benzoquinol methylase
MTPSADAHRIEADFDRLAAFDGDGWSHNNHYHTYLLRQCPAQMETALEVGCGSGMFTRLLATRATHVTGLDLSGEMLRLARERTPQQMPIDYVQADVLDCLTPTPRYDVIASIATLHHLPLDVILPRLRNALKPGGVLLVLDLFETENGLDYVVTGVAGMVMSHILHRWHGVSRRDAPEVQAAWEAHGAHDVYPRLSEVRQLCARLLPGAFVRKHVLWRYSLVWRKPR